MKIFSPTLKGTTTVSGGTTDLSGSFVGTFSGSVAGIAGDVSSYSASVALRATALEAASGSFSTRTTTLEGASASFSSRTTAIERVYATTGSNYFIGTQVVTGSMYISSDLVVQGSSSLQNITASAVSIGTNTVILNTAAPAVRFAGISVTDSGSNSAVTSSIWYDSLNNRWIYQNESGSTYSGGMLISGPRNTGSLGDETGISNGYIAKGLGGDHIGPSIIFETGSNIGIGTTSPATPLHLLTSGLPAIRLTLGSEARVHNITGVNNGRDLLISPFRHFTVQTGNGISEGQISLNAYEDFIVGTGSSYSQRLIISSTGAATFSSSVTATIFDSTSNAFRFSGSNALSLVTLGGQSVVKINAAGYWGTQLVGANDKGILIDNSGNVGIGTTSPSSILNIVSSVTNDNLSPESQVTISNSNSGYYSTLGFRTTDSDGTHGRAGITVSKDSGSVTGAMNFLIRKNSGTFLQAMRITSDGDIYINTSARINSGGYSNALSIKAGITNTWGLVEVRGSSTTTGGELHLGGDTTLYAALVGEYVTANNGNLYIRTLRSGTITNAMTVTSGGNVGIGTTSPGSKLQIGAMTSYTGGGYTFAMGNGTTDFLITLNTAQVGSSTTFYSSTDFYFTKSGPSSTGVISAWGFTNLSDYRLKYDLEQYNSLAILSQVKTYKYKMVDTQETQYGVLAHEIQEILPHIVVGEKDGDRMQAVDYQKIVPILIKAVQELSAKVTALEVR